MLRYAQKTGEMPVNDSTRMELLIATCPAALEDVIRSWLLTNKSATYGVVEQLIFDKIQQKVWSFKAPMQTDAVAEAACAICRLELRLDIHPGFDK